MQLSIFCCKCCSLMPDLLSVQGCKVLILQGYWSSMFSRKPRCGHVLLGGRRVLKRVSIMTRCSCWSRWWLFRRRSIVNFFAIRASKLRWRLCLLIIVSEILYDPLWLEFPLWFAINNRFNLLLDTLINTSKTISALRLLDILDISKLCSFIIWIFLRRHQPGIRKILSLAITFRESGSCLLVVNDLFFLNSRSERWSNPFSISILLFYFCSNPINIWVHISISGLAFKGT